MAFDIKDLNVPAGQPAHEVLGMEPNQPWLQPDLYVEDDAPPDLAATITEVMRIPGMFPIDPDDYTSQEFYYELAGDTPTEPDSVATGPKKSSGADRVPGPPPSSVKVGKTGAWRKKIVPPAKKTQKGAMIAVFGITGTGKSTFISKLTGKDVAIGHSLHSCTSDIQEVTCKIGAVDVTLVDTPGFDDTTVSDTEILRRIASWMQDTYADGTYLNGVIYFHRISDKRMTGTSLKNLRLLKNLCGMGSLKHVMLASTMWDTVTEEEGNMRELELLTDDSFWGDLKKNGAMVRRHDGQHRGALDLVNQLIELSPVKLEIQKELVEQKKLLVETAAGRAVEQAIDALAEKHKKEMDEIKKDMEDAMRQKDDDLRKELLAQKEELEGKLREQKVEKEALRAPINRKPWWRRSWTCKFCHLPLKMEKDGRQSDPKGKCPSCKKEQVFLR